MSWCGGPEPSQKRRDLGVDLIIFGVKKAGFQRVVYNKQLNPLAAG
jgi:hypothetical protein